MTVKEYNACVDSHADGLYRFMLRGVDDGEKAKDLVQDAFEKLWIQHDQLEAAKAKSYLFTTAYRAMIDGLRRDKCHNRMTELTQTANHHTHQYSDLNEALHRFLEQLPREQQSVVLLRDYEGYSYAEIGQITGLNESQVKVYIHRARVFLRECIGSVDRLI